MYTSFQYFYFFFQVRLTQASWQEIDGLVQDCSNFIANALELLQSLH